MWKWILMALVGGLLIAGAIGANKKKTSELPVYVEGADRMLQGAEIYRTDDKKPFTYPPFFALPFVPLALTPVGAHRLIWFFVNALVLAFVIWRVHVLFRPILRGPSVWFWGITLALSARHVSSVFENQSHDLLVFGLMMSAAEAWLKGQQAVAGARAGLAAACKATPLLSLVLFASQLRPIAVISLFATIALATYLPDLLAPRADGGSWAVVWYDTFLSGLSVGGTAEGGNAWFKHSYLNQGLSGTLTRLFVPYPGDDDFYVYSLIADLGGATKWVTMAFQGGIVAVIAGVTFLRRRPRTELAGLGEMGLVLCGMVLLSPMSSKSHFCVLLLPVAFCVRHYLDRGRDKILAGLLIAVFVLGTLTVKGIWGRELGNQFLAYGSVTWTAFAVFLATAHVLWWGDRRQIGADT